MTMTSPQEPPRTGASLSLRDESHLVHAERSRLTSRGEAGEVKRRERAALCATGHQATYLSAAVSRSHPWPTMQCNALYTALSPASPELCIALALLLTLSAQAPLRSSRSSAASRSSVSLIDAQYDSSSASVAASAGACAGEDEDGEGEGCAQEGTVGRCASKTPGRRCCSARASPSSCEGDRASVSPAESEDGRRQESEQPGRTHVVHLEPPHDPPYADRKRPHGDHRRDPERLCSIDSRVEPVLDRRRGSLALLVQLVERVEPRGKGRRLGRQGRVGEEI